MLDAFRALGGAAQNFVQGTEGRGLFAVNAADPVLLRVPRNLLFRTSDVEFIESRIGIREAARVPEAERRFFEQYENAFACEGRARSVAFITALNGLPTEIKELLSREFGLPALLEGDITRRIQTHILRSREVPWHGGAVIAPVLELADHGTEGLAYERGMHLQIQGYVGNEIRLRHGNEDAFSSFCRTGIADRKLAAFSLSLSVSFENRQIAIGQSTNDATARGRDRVPTTSSDAGRVSFSYLLLGHRRMPRLPRGTLRTLLQEAGFKNPDDAFDNIVRLNALKFIKLLQTLEPHEGEMISKLRMMARYQLEAMSYAIGSRELAPVVSE
jgi:hypothetical protein